MHLFPVALACLLITGVSCSVAKTPQENMVACSPSSNFSLMSCLSRLGDEGLSSVQPGEETCFRLSRVVVGQGAMASH